MSALKFLTRVSNGAISLVSAITASAGGADGNKVVATGADGKLDPTLFPAGVEIQTEIAEATEALIAGDFVNIYDNAGSPAVRKAVANNPAKLANGFVLAGAAITDEVTIYTKGVNTQIVATEGLKYYLSSATAGLATSTAPTDTAGHFQQVLGIGVPSGLLFEFDDPIYFA